MAKRALQFLSNLLILFALAAFMILPVRSLYFLSLALITLAAAAAIMQKPLFSRQTWIWLLGILLAEHLIRYAFYPVGLARIAVPMAIALALVCLSMKTRKHSTCFFMGIGAIAAFALLGIIAYGFYIPVKKQNSSLNGPVVFLGDSLTAGEDPDKDADILYPAQLQRSFTTPMINAGRGAFVPSCETSTKSPDPDDAFWAIALPIRRLEHLCQKIHQPAAQSVYILTNIKGL